MITTKSRIKRNGRADSALTCSASVGPDFATNGEQTATTSFAVYGERAQLLTLNLIRWYELANSGLFRRYYITHTKIVP